MVVSVIQSQISATDLTLKPGYSSAALDVEVVNNSDRHASFHIVLAATGDDGQQPRRWYQLTPLTSSKTPPGTRSRFTINIIDTPLPGFVGLANVTVRIISPELQSEERHILRLRVEPGVGTVSFKVELPTTNFQDYPGQIFDIPARIYNYNRNPLSIILSYPGLDNWVMENSPTDLLLLPNRWQNIVITCQIPTDLSLSRSQDYPFQVLVVDAEGDAATASGVLKVLPMGYFELAAEQSTLTIPASPGWFPNRRDVSTQTRLRLENHSNAKDTLSIEALPSPEDTAHRNCQVTLEPDTLLLDLGRTQTVETSIQADRPWLGWVRIILIDIQARLKQTRLELRNDTETLQIRVFPIIPRWLQLLAILIFVGAIAGLWFFHVYRQHHRQLVSAVQFNGIGDRVISGSSDQTVRQWQVRPRGLRPIGDLIQLDKAVRVLHYRPVDNNQIAVGLENGEIQLWDLLKQPEQPLRTLVKQGGKHSGLDDRVMALTTTLDASHLFSGYGSGWVYQWYIGPNSSTLDVDWRLPINKLFIPELAVYDVALLGPNNQTLAIAGRYNKLLLWNWLQASNQKSSRGSRLTMHNDAETVAFPIGYPSGGQDDYITSLAVAEQKTFHLATADNQGRIMVWDVENCLHQTGSCTIIDQWRPDPDTAIRDIAFSSNGCYLVSASDNGRVMLWPLTSRGRRLTKYLEGQAVAKSKTRFNSVDIKVVESRILVVSGADDSRVRLHRLKKTGRACEG